MILRTHIQFLHSALINIHFLSPSLYLSHINENHCFFRSEYHKIRVLLFLSDYNYTYFVKGDDYYTFHNLMVKVKSYSPRSFKADWLNCQSTNKDKHEVSTEKPADPAISPKLIAIICVSILGVVLIISGISYVMWRRQRRYKKGAVVYRSETGTSVQVLDNDGDKTLCVTSWQQRCRLFRFNLQGKVQRACITFLLHLNSLDLHSIMLVTLVLLPLYNYCFNYA